MAADTSGKSEQFKYGFNVHSISKVSQSQQQSPKKQQNKKNRNKQQKHHQSASKPSPQSLCIELYTSSVSKLLDNEHLNASSATSLHDLQCGTATFIIQAFLEHQNLRRVFGVEQNKNLFHWATKNLLSLIKNGYKGNKFLLVEQIPSIKMTVAQKSPKSENDVKAFKTGDIVYCFIPLKQTNITKRDNYQGVIRSVNKDGIHYDVEMSATKKVVKNVHRETIFKPGTERTLEIARGNLFERSDSFRADIVLLPNHISNDSFKSLLLTGCKRSPIGSRILSYCYLEIWDGFPMHSLRRIDANVYDNDRYQSSSSPHLKLYTYSHILAASLADSPKDILLNCGIGNDVLVRDQQLMIWYTGKVQSIDNKNRKMRVLKNNFILDRGIEDIKVDDQRVHLITRKFKMGDVVCSYCPKMIEKEHDEMYTLYRGQVVDINDDGTYKVQYEDGETHPKVYEFMIFSPPKYRYKEGQIVSSKRYDKIKVDDDDGTSLNSHFKNIRNLNVSTENAIIRHLNPDGTYRVQFYNSKQFQFHDSFCECYLNDIDDLKQEIDPILPLSLEIDYDKVLKWRPNVVKHWLITCGINNKIATIFYENGVNGIFLFDLDLDLITNEMKISLNDGNIILTYIRALKSEMHFQTNEDEEQIKQMQMEIQQYQTKLTLTTKNNQIEQTKLEKLIKSNMDKYREYEEYELKQQCIALSQKKVSKKEIAQQLKKTQSWVKKVLKAKSNQIKKPGGSIIKQIEQLRNSINKNNKQIKQLQQKLFLSRQKYQQFME